jgi:hypothetical protein
MILQWQKFNLKKWADWMSFLFAYYFSDIFTFLRVFTYLRIYLVHSISGTRSVVVVVVVVVMVMVMVVVVVVVVMVVVVQ